MMGTSESGDIHVSYHDIIHRHTHAAHLAGNMHDASTLESDFLVGTGTESSTKLEQKKITGIVNETRKNNRQRNS